MNHNHEQFSYSDERFADLQMLRYRLNGFENLSLSQQLYIYCLSKATLMGRDITFDQQGKYNLLIRKTLEAIYKNYDGPKDESFLAFEVYLVAFTIIMDVKSLSQVSLKVISISW